MWLRMHVCRQAQHQCGGVTVNAMCHLQGKAAAAAGSAAAAAAAGAAAAKAAGEAAAGKKPAAAGKAAGSKDAADTSRKDRIQDLLGLKSKVASPAKQARSLEEDSDEEEDEVSEVPQPSRGSGRSRRAQVGTRLATDCLPAAVVVCLMECMPGDDELVIAPCAPDCMWGQLYAGGTLSRPLALLGTGSDVVQDTCPPAAVGTSTLAWVPAC